MRGTANLDGLLAADVYNHAEGSARGAAQQGGHQRLVLLRAGHSAAVQLRLRSQPGDYPRYFWRPAVDRVRIRRRDDPQPQLRARVAERLFGRADRFARAGLGAVPGKGSRECAAAAGDRSGVLPSLRALLQCQVDATVLAAAGGSRTRHMGDYGDRNHVQRPDSKSEAARSDAAAAGLSDDDSMPDVRDEAFEPTARRRSAGLGSDDLDAASDRFRRDLYIAGPDAGRNSSGRL